MKTSYHIDTTMNLIAAKRSGPVRMMETLDLIGAIMADDKFRKGMGLAYDLTEAEGDWSLSEIDHLRSYVNRIGGRYGSAKWAFVAKEGPIEATIRILILLYNTGRKTITMRLFRAKYDAVKWITAAEDGRPAAR
jgi:hypothetical protein